MNVAHPSYPFKQPNSHPLYVVTIGLIAGIAVESVCFPFIMPLVALFSVSILSCLLFNVNKLRLIIFLLVGLLVGCLCMHQQLMRAHDTQWTSSKKAVSCKAVIGAINRTDQTFSTCITLYVTDMQQENGIWVPCKKTINWYTTKMPPLCVDDYIQLSQVIIKPIEQNDFGFYLLKEGIDGTLFATQTSYSLIRRPSWSFNRFIAHWRSTIFTNIKRKMSRAHFALFSSLFLGNRTNCKRELLSFSEHFRQWGISHQLARSGLHLVIFSLVWERLLHYLPIPFVCKRMVLLLLSGIYYLLSWSTISFIRSFLSFIMYQTSILFLIPTRAVYTLFFICFMVLFLNPAQLFFLDFQLSFALTFALAWFYQLYSPYQLTTNTTAR